MNIDFVIIGGGCYGTYYVRQLLAARDRGKIEWGRILVLDRDIDCPVARLGLEDVEVVQTRWEAWNPEPFRALLKHAQLVPAPIAPHVLKHWIENRLSGSWIVKDARWDRPVPQLPYAAVLDRGTLVLSHAPGMCPTNCIEPRKCPLTRNARDWEMSQTVKSLGAADLTQVFVCAHFAYGVGTIPFRDIFEAFDRFDVVDTAQTIAIATVSGCHGLIDLVTIAQPS